MLNLFLKYAKGHVYELHGLLAATIAFLCMFWIKKPIKLEIDNYIQKKAERNSMTVHSAILFRKRLGIIIICMDLLLSGAIFGVISAISPMIHFSEKTMWLSGILSLTEYAIYEQIAYRKKALNYE